MLAGASCDFRFPVFTQVQTFAERNEYLVPQSERILFHARYHVDGDPEIVRERYRTGGGSLRRH